MRSFVHTADNSAAGAGTSCAGHHAKPTHGRQVSRKNLHGAAALTATQKTAARGRCPNTPASTSSSAAAPSESAKESDNMAPGLRVVERSPSSSMKPEPITPLTVEALTEHTLRTTPKLLKTDNGVLLEIATWCEAPELLVLSGVSSRFRGTIHAHDNFLWRGLCKSLWSGRFLSTPQLMPYVNALNNPPSNHSYHHLHQVGSPVAPKATSPASHVAAAGAGGPEFPATHSKPATSHKIATWREAFVRSIAQSKKTRLSADELHASQWEISFLVDDSIPSQAITFNTQTGVVRTEGFDPMRYQLYQQGGQLHVHVFPTQTVTRDEDTWQWVLHNPFVEIRNVTSPGPAVGGSTAPLPELRPWFKLSSPSSQGGDRLFSSCRDTELGVPHSDDSSSSSVQSGSEEVDPELPLFTGSKRKQRRDKEKFKRQTYTCDLGDDLPFTFVGGAPKFQQDATHDGFLPGTKVAGHGGGCDGEDPPPFRDTGDPASRPACSGAGEDSDSESDSGATAGGTNQGKGNTGGTSWRKNTQQKCASVLSQSTASYNSFLENLFSQEEALWEQMGALHSSQQRALWSTCPSIVECHESEHLLDPGRPRRPP